MLVKGLHIVCTELSNFAISKVSGVTWAHAFHWSGVGANAEWPQLFSGSVKVRCQIFWQVAIGALDPLTVKMFCPTRVIETLQPHGAVVSSQRPLTDPDGVLYPRGLRENQRVDLRVLVDREQLWPEEHV